MRDWDKAPGKKFGAISASIAGVSAGSKNLVMVIIQALIWNGLRRIGDFTFAHDR